MRAPIETEVSSLPEAARFAATHWSVVLAAKNGTGHGGKDALEALCQQYWPPLYSFVRRQGYAPHDAQDLTQAFFERFLEKDYLNAVDQTKGKFRSFLLAAMKNFLASEWRDAHCQKRAGNYQHVSIDDVEAEQFYAQSANLQIPAEKIFERQWAMTLLQNVLVRLQKEFLLSGKQMLFDRVKIFLTGDGVKRGHSYAAIAVELDMTEAAVKMAVSRLLRRYGELLRAEVARTVSTPEEIEGEMKALLAALSC